MIAQNEYALRRRDLARRLPAASVAIIPAASERWRNGDSHYRFRQDSDFYYLTGFEEPDAVLVVFAGSSGESVLFNRPRNVAEEQWTGPRLGQEGACAVLGMDSAYPLMEVDTRLPELLADKHALYYPIGRYPIWAKRVLNAWKTVKGQVRRGIVAPEAFYDVAPVLGEMRLFKSAGEIACMKEAARISVAAHERAMRACLKAEYEYQLEAELLYEFTRQGCRSVAYDPIVAGGGNACVLHYTQNHAPLQSGALVLIDAGGEFQNYAADITRTFPINGTFTPEQRLIYELVLDAQKAGMACVRPGSLWDDIQKAIVRVLTDGLLHLGLLKGSLDQLMEQEAYKPFYMHSSGHWLGLDVHDCGQYKCHGQWRPLEANMALTVEPGLYIPEMPQIESRWWGIGVRIEDDLYVTQEGYENMSADLVVEVADVEALIGG